MHNATRSVFGKWKYERFGFSGEIDWNKVSAKEIEELAEKMFEAAGVPVKSRIQYYEAFMEFILRLS